MILEKLGIIGVELKPETKATEIHQSCTNLY